MIITAASVETALGNKPEKVLTALLKKQSAAVKNCDVTVLSGDGFGYVPILNAPVKSLYFSRPFDRIVELCIRCLEDIILKLPTSLNSKRVLFYFSLPDLDLEEIKRAVLTVFPDLYGCDFMFIHQYKSFLELMDHVSKELEQEKWDIVLLGGVDSLINEETYQKMIEQGNIRKQGCLEAEMPGEGAAFVMLQRKKENSSQFSIKMKKFDLLGSLPDNIEIIISDRSCTRKSDSIWYEKTKHLWDERMPLEIRTKRWLGNLGIAHHSMMLAVGFARLQASSEKQKNGLLFFEKCNKFEVLELYT